MPSDATNSALGDLCSPPSEELHCNSTITHETTVSIRLIYSLSISSIINSSSNSLNSRSEWVSLLKRIQSTADTDRVSNSAQCLSLTSQPMSPVSWQHSFLDHLISLLIYCCCCWSDPLQKKPKAPSFQTTSGRLTGLFFK